MSRGEDGSLGPDAQLFAEATQELIATILAMDTAALLKLPSELLLAIDQLLASSQCDPLPSTPSAGDAEASADFGHDRAAASAAQFVGFAGLGSLTAMAAARRDWMGLFVERSGEDDAEGLCLPDDSAPITIRTSLTEETWEPDASECSLQRWRTEEPESDWSNDGDLQIPEGTALAIPATIPANSGRPLAVVPELPCRAEEDPEFLDLEIPAGGLVPIAHMSSDGDELDFLAGFGAWPRHRRNHSGDSNSSATSTTTVPLSDDCKLYAVRRLGRPGGRDVAHMQGTPMAVEREDTWEGLSLPDEGLSEERLAQAEEQRADAMDAEGEDSWLLEENADAARQSGGRAAPHTLQGSRKGPALIANLNEALEPRVIGKMRFDPDNKVWLGNEEVLREFEPKKGPALIQNINRSFVQTVVGAMVFDGERMRWVGNEEELAAFDCLEQDSDEVDDDRTTIHSAEREGASLQLGEGEKAALYRSELSHRQQLGHWLAHRFEMQDLRSRDLWNIRNRAVGAQ